MTQEMILKPICDECGSQQNVQPVRNIRLCASCRNVVRPTDTNKASLGKLAVFATNDIEHDRETALTDNQVYDLGVETLGFVLEWVFDQIGYGQTLAAIEDSLFVFRQQERDALTVRMLDRLYPGSSRPDADQALRESRDNAFAVLRKMDHASFMEQVKFWLGGAR